MAEQHVLSSFVLRFTPMGRDAETGERRWRIKVTYVQGKDEVSVTTLEEAVGYMKTVLEEEDRDAG